MTPENAKRVLFRRIRRDPGKICKEGYDYISDKEDLESAWNRCTKGQFLYTWLKWFCDVDWRIIQHTLGYDVSHYGAYIVGVGLVPDITFADDIRKHFTYWGELKNEPKGRAF